MADPDPKIEQLKKLQKWRVREDPDLSLGFIERQFKVQIERPYKQLQSLVELWIELLPPDMVEHTRLDSLARSVLTVSVDSSARLYELDRLLRSGLEQQLIKGHKGPAFRRVKLIVGRIG